MENHELEPYAHEWEIKVKADTLQGAMNAVWNCWDSWHRGAEPLGGTTPESMGERMTYDVWKTKKPATPAPK